MRVAFATCVCKALTLALGWTGVHFVVLGQVDRVQSTGMDWRPWEGKGAGGKGVYLRWAGSIRGYYYGVESIAGGCYVYEVDAGGA